MTRGKTHSLKSEVNDGAGTFAHCLRIHEEMLSGPYALLASNPVNNNIKSSVPMPSIIKE